MQKLSHPNVIRYLGVEVHTTEVYIFMEYCSEGSLANLVRNGMGVDEAMVRKYTQMILQGVQYLHSQGIIHRDIKPDNIMRDSHGMLKLADFGSSELTNVMGLAPVVGSAAGQRAAGRALSSKMARARVMTQRRTRLGAAHGGGGADGTGGGTRRPHTWTCETTAATSPRAR